jgi:hypothetical protein
LKLYNLILNNKSLIPGRGDDSQLRLHFDSVNLFYE